jgi:hypothetical protein
MPLRRDVRDLFFLAGWARPRLYLDGTVRAGISHFAKAMRDPREAAVVADAVARLDKDLASGRWQRDFGAPMADKPTYDGGYRIVAVTRR